MSDIGAATAAALSVFVYLVFSRAARALRGRRVVRARLANSTSRGKNFAPPKRSLLAGPAARFASTQVGSRLAVSVHRARPSLAFSDFIAYCLACAVGAGFAASFLFGIGPLALLVSVCALFGPVIFIRRLQGQRLHRLEEQLGPGLGLQSSALRSGASLLRSLEHVADKAPSPLSDEIRLVMNDLSLGRPMQEALGLLSQRAPSRDIELWVTAMLVHQQAGGNLATVLDIVSGEIRERFGLRRELRALTAQGRLSGLVVSVAPLGFLALLSVAAKDEMRSVYSSSMGLMIILAGLALEVCGYLWIRKICSVVE